MSNELNHIHQSLLNIPFSLFQFWGFLICMKMKKTYFATCSKNRLKVSFENAGKYHHCLITNGSGTKRP